MLLLLEASSKRERENKFELEKGIIAICLDKPCIYTEKEEIFNCFFCATSVIIVQIHLIFIVCWTYSLLKSFLIFIMYSDLVIRKFAGIEPVRKFLVSVFY
jgi:hypothetical protein